MLFADKKTTTDFVPLCSKEGKIEDKGLRSQEEGRNEKNDYIAGFSFKTFSEYQCHIG